MNNEVAYQVISRNNDSNGNPYRLILVYDAGFRVVHVVESRQSMPNYVYHECRGLIELPSFHIEPRRYNALKSRYDIVSET
jgi:hypothetical protein